MVTLYNLFERMKDLNLTAKKVSECTGISTGNISDWKSGRSMPSAVKLDILADYLGCSVDYLLGRETAVTNGNISNNVVMADNNHDNHVSISNHPAIAAAKDDQETEMLRIFRTLDMRDKHTALGMLYEMEDKQQRQQRQ